MKGVIFNVLESFVDENFGEDAFTEIVEQCDLETKEPFVGPGTYPFNDLLKLVVWVHENKKMEVKDILFAFGEYAFPHLYSLIPDLVSEIKTPKDFLLSVEDITHVEVKKLYTQAETPTFNILENKEKYLSLEYISSKNLCYLMEGLISGLGKQYKTEITVKQNECIHNGNDTCVFSIEFS